MSKCEVNDSILHKTGDKVFTCQEKEIMRILTSKKWSEPTYLRRYNIYNIVEKKEIKTDQNLVNNESDESVNEFSLYPKNIDQESVISSSWSLNTSTINRDIIGQVQSDNRIAKNQSEEFAINEAVKMITKKAKKSLGKILVEGLYEVSKNYRHDPFRSLGIWLLIQADLRDENNIDQESYDSNEDIP